ncbi:MAG: hypothetical protein PHD76_13075 [Methylacidiphilales bacterium]|nr:hypothetical protein [Candidatus Methylacidiphilales bacterium]
MVTLADGLEENGRLSLNAKAVFVEGLSKREINLPDILEADFSDSDFHLEYFSSNDTPDKLPGDWKSQNIGKNDVPGSFSYSLGVFKLVGNIHEHIDYHDSSEYSFFIGCPWPGNGQWTLRVKDFNPLNARASAGIVLREGFNPVSGGRFQICVTGENGGFIEMRAPGGSSYSFGLPMDIPVWLRLTRNEANLAVSMSIDGRNWDIVSQNTTKFSTDVWVGLYIDSGQQPGGKNTVDEVTFTPGPSLSDILPAGVLLRDGSYLAGGFGGFDITGPDSVGAFNRNGKMISIAAAQIATVVIYPTGRGQILKLGPRPGLFLKNGDFLAGDIESIYWEDNVRINSLILGINSYDRNVTKCVVLNSLMPQPSAYEIRLTDGSIVRATGVTVDKSHVVILEASGLSVTVDANEIEQFRAGPSRVQALLELPWKAAQDKKQAPVECWEGNHQEQILAIPAGSALNFPLKGKFRALGMRVASLPGSSSNARAVIRILADGKEMGRTPSIHAGEQPRFVRFPIQDVKTLTLAVDSNFIGTRVLVIDPVAILEN